MSSSSSRADFRVVVPRIRGRVAVASVVILIFGGRFLSYRTRTIVVN